MKPYFVKALTEGFDEMPTINENLRNELNFTFETKGLETLLNQLEEQ